MGRATLESLAPELVANANILIPKINDLLETFGEYRSVNSGYRRPEDNAKVAVPKLKSAHLTCEAIDLEDRDGRLKAWLMKNRQMLVLQDLYMEHPDYCPTWCHLQTRAPKSRNRVFIP